MPVRVTASMIVRDEERFLEGCLASLQGQVDEIVIADTGSEDASREIARAHGARVFDFPWTGDFSAARNAALDASTGDWILYIDADERLHVPNGARLSELLDDPEAAAATVLFEPSSGFTPYRHYRLFRNDPRIRFVGRIHETMLPGIEQACREDGLVIRHSQIRLKHLGYEGDLTHKHRRNVPLLRESLREDPNQPFCWQDLAKSLAALGEIDEALEACRRAVQVVRGSPDRKKRVDASIAIHTWARLLGEAGQDPLPVIEDGLRMLPENRGLLLLRARALVNAARYEEALAALDELTAEDPDTFEDHLIAYDRRIFGEFAHDQRGIALMRLGRFDEAAAAFDKAAAAAPDDLSYRAKAAAMRGHAARLARAAS